jgi:hypothetical protein
MSDDATRIGRRRLPSGPVWLQLGGAGCLIAGTALVAVWLGLLVAGACLLAAGTIAEVERAARGPR